MMALHSKYKNYPHGKSTDFSTMAKQSLGICMSEHSDNLI